MAVAGADGVPPTQAQLELQAYRRRLGPPDNEVPLIVAVRHVLWQDAGVAVSLLGAQVFSRGLRLEVVVQFSEPPTAQQHRALRAVRVPSGLDVRARWPDGRTTGLVSGFWSAERAALVQDPDRLMLAMLPGVTGSPERSVLPIWLGPLPGPGTATLTLAWPGLHLPRPTSPWTAATSRQQAGGHRCCGRSAGT